MIKLKESTKINILGLIIFTIIAFLTVNTIFSACAERPNYVYDWEDLLTDVEESDIEQFCLDVDEATTAEIVTITIADLEGRTHEQAAVYYFNEYPLDGVKGIGKAGKDNGVLVLVSLTEGYWKIEVGYALEGDLTDSECGRIGRDILVKHLKEGDNFEAFYDTVKAIAGEIGYGEAGETVTTEVIPKGVWIGLGLAVAIIILIVVVWVSSNGDGGGSGGWSSGGSGGGGGGGFGGGGSGGGGSGGTIGNPITVSIPKLFYKETKCPTCGKDRMCQVKGEYTDEAEMHDGWWWLYSITSLLCLTCGGGFNQSEPLKKLETIGERQRREEEKRRRREERQRQEEEERRERRRREEQERRQRSESSRPSFDFGRGRSGGAGSSGRIR